MNILINASNLKAGGGIQVADSICKSLNQFTRHRFVVVLSSFFQKTPKAIEDYSNVKVFIYNIKNTITTLLLGRDNYLDNIVKKENVDIVLTIFGPSRWNPKCLHISGFALSFLVMPESPYFQRMNWKEKAKAKLRNKMWEIYFRRSAKYFFTENPMISERVEKLFKGSKVYTVTNYYNQVFDDKEKWVQHAIPPFDGITLLDIASPQPHKNMAIGIDIIKYMRKHHPKVNLRFVYTADKSHLPNITEDMNDNFLLIGKVNVDECPSLYEQCDIVFQPTLLECFTATYPEAMRMRKPIVTTDIGFARGLCENAALYYSPLDAGQAAERIFEIVSNPSVQCRLIEEGIKQLNKYDTYNQRPQKLIELCEQIYRN